MEALQKDCNLPNPHKVQGSKVDPLRQELLPSSNKRCFSKKSARCGDLIWLGILKSAPLVLMIVVRRVCFFLIYANLVFKFVYIPLNF